jgi:hypothetical protein
MSHFDKIHMLPRLTIVRVANQNAQNSVFFHDRNSQKASIHKKKTTRRTCITTRVLLSKYGVLETLEPNASDKTKIVNFTFSS